MANLLGQNIGTNYKGILNLNTLNGNLTTTLEAITDGDGNASTLLLSTTLARVSSNLTIGGSTTASARLHVRGDGTNAVARFESSAGAAVLRTGIGTNNSVLLIGSSAVQPALINVLGAGGAANLGGNYLEFLIQNADNTAGNIGFRFNGSNSGFGNITGVSFFSDYTHSYGAAAGSGNYRFHNYAYTINNSGAQTGTATGIFLNATETALNGMGHNLMDLQVGGATRFRVNNVGNIIALNFAISRDGSTGADGNIVLSNTAGTSFGLLKLGGTTNAFPAIKRNGAAIDFRLADDSAFADINANNVYVPTQFRNVGLSAGTAFRFANNEIRASITGNDGEFKIYNPGVDSNVFWMQANGSLAINKGSAAVASAVLEVTSTTKGFLPPRMTTTQKNAITTPATGLVLYDSTLNKLCVYTGSAWETITSV